MTISKTLDELAATLQFTPYSALYDSIGVPRDYVSDDFIKDRYDCRSALNAFGFASNDDWGDPAPREKSFAKKHPYLTAAFVIPIIPAVAITLYDGFDNIGEGIVYEKDFNIGPDGKSDTQDDILTFKMSNMRGGLTTTGIIDKDTEMKNGMSVQNYNEVINTGNGNNDGIYIKFSTDSCDIDWSYYGRPVCHVEEVLELSTAEAKRQQSEPKEVIAALSAAYGFLGVIGFGLYKSGKGISNIVKNRKKNGSR